MKSFVICKSNLFWLRIAGISAELGFWSHLGCSGQNAVIFNREGLLYGYTRKIYIVCVLTWSLLGVKKILGAAQIGLP